MLALNAEKTLIRNGVKTMQVYHRDLRSVSEEAIQTMSACKLTHFMSFVRLTRFPF
jgi:hypothetical protein